jgi:hypothetical protein
MDVGISDLLEDDAEGKLAASTAFSVPGRPHLERDRCCPVFALGHLQDQVPPLSDLGCADRLAGFATRIVHGCGSI